MSGKKIIDGLNDAIAGNLSRITIDGVTWYRADLVAAAEDAAIFQTRQHVADAMARVCRKAAEAGDLDKARRFADAQKCIADVFKTVTL